MMEKIQKSEQEWREQLTEEQYRITRQKGTERPFTGEYVHNKETGVYLCVACGNTLFNSETKYDSGSGWPSFYAPIDPEKVEISVWGCAASRSCAAGAVHTWVTSSRMAPGRPDCVTASTRLR